MRCGRGAAGPSGDVGSVGALPARPTSSSRSARRTRQSTSRGRGAALRASTSTRTRSRRSGAARSPRCSRDSSMAASSRPPEPEAGTTLVLSGDDAGVVSALFRGRRSRRASCRAHRRSRWRTPRGRRNERRCCCDPRRRRAQWRRGRMGARSAELHGSSARRGSSCEEGLALGRRDGGDRRHLRCCRPA